MVLRNGLCQALLGRLSRNSTRRAGLLRGEFDALPLIEFEIDVYRHYTESSMNRKSQIPTQSVNDALGAGEVPRLSNMLGLSMRRVAFLSTDVLAERLAEHDSTPTRLTALLVIAEKPGLKLVELANTLGIARSGAVVLVDELEARGHVKRRPMVGDRRAHSLVPTAKGLKALGPLCEVAAECDQHSYGALNQRDRQSLLRLLEKLVA